MEQRRLSPSCLCPALYEDELLCPDDDDPAPSLPDTRRLCAPCFAEEPEQVEDVAAAEAKTRLEAAAVHLQTTLAQHAYTSNNSVARDLGCDRRLALARLEAAAECCLQKQKQLLHECVNYVKMQAGRMEPVCFIERCSYDGTDAELRVPDVLDNDMGQKVKLYMVETEWAMLLRERVETDLQGVCLGPDKYLLLRGKLSPAPRISQRGTGENIKSVLLSADDLPPDLASVFCNRVIRICEADEDGANGKAERLLQSVRGRQWTDSTLTVLCAAHKAHNSAERTWTFTLPLLSGMTNTSKALLEIDMLKALKVMLLAEAGRRLVIHDASVELCLEAEEYRRHTMSLYLPPASQPKRRARMLAVCTGLLNGDWRRPNILIHRCQPGCCGSRKETLAKIHKFFVPALLAQRPSMFSKNNWKDWTLQTNFYGWASSLHAFGQDVLIKVLSGQRARDVSAESVAASNLLGLPSLASFADLPDQNHVDDDMARMRAEKARWVKIAAEWLPTSWPVDLWLLRCALTPEVRVMSHLLDISSENFEVHNLHRLHTEGKWDSPVMALWRSDVFYEACKLATEQMGSHSLFAHMAETEALRSNIFKFSVRAAAVLWHLLFERYKRYPWALFALLHNPSPEVAAGILRESCLHDAWTIKFLQYVDSPEKLLSSDMLQTLRACSALIVGTTYGVERMHSSNTKRAKHRVQCKRMDVSRVSLKHAAVATKTWMRDAQLTQLHRKRGRPPNKIKDTARKQRRTLQTTGAWRVFLKEQAAGVYLQPHVVRALSAQYRSLTAEEKARYKLLSDLGARGVVKLKVTQDIASMSCSVLQTQSRK